MMGPFAKAITVGCLDALRWLLWLVAALLAALIVVQFVRNDAGAQPVQFAIIAVVGLTGGWLCGVASRRLSGASQ